MTTPVTKLKPRFYKLMKERNPRGFILDGVEYHFMLDRQLPVNKWFKPEEKYADPDVKNPSTTAELLKIQDYERELAIRVNFRMSDEERRAAHIRVKDIFREDVTFF